MSGPDVYARMRALADRLIASCDGGRDEQDELNDISVTEAEVLDTMALECHACGQYFDASEMTDDGGEYACRDCHGQ